MRIIKVLASRARRFALNQAGISAVEFALILPLMIIVFIGGYVIADAVVIRRKVAIVSRTVADLATQVASISTSDMSTLLGASTGVIAPYSSANLSIRLSEITVNNTGTIATVTWSAGLNATKFACNQAFTIPSNMYQANASYVLSQISYNFIPVVGTSLVGSLVLSDTLYMVPRVSQSISYPCPD